MEKEILEEMHQRIFRNFLDTIVLVKLREQDDAMSGYDVVTFIHEKLRIRVSCGTVYSLLYSMERDGVIKGMLDNRRRVYTLTDKGEKRIETIFKVKRRILGLVVNLFI